MANSPLIPTSRVDKNGRTTIRHMKADTSVSSKMAVPVPKLPVSSMEDFDRKSATRGIVFIMEEYGGVKDPKELKHALKSLSDEDVMKLQGIGNTLQDLLLNQRRTRIGQNCAQVVKAIHSGDTEAIGIYHRYREQVSSNYSYEHMDATRSVLEEMGVYEPFSGYEPASFDAHMRMTLEYSPLEEEILDSDTDGGLVRMKQVQNYSRVRHLVEYVENHPERVDDIIFFRTEREENSFDDMVEFFNAIEKSNAPAVKEGWL